MLETFDLNQAKEIHLQFINGKKGMLKPERNNNITADDKGITVFTEISKTNKRVDFFPYASIERIVVIYQREDSNEKGD